MAQSQPDAEDACRAAQGAAFDKSYDYCGTEEDRLAFFGNLVGVDADDLPADPSAAIASGPGDSAADVETRAWVASKALEIAGESGSPRSALNEAWAAAADAMEAGDEGDFTPASDLDEADDAEAADADEEAEVEAADPETDETDDAIEANLDDTPDDEADAEA